MTFSRSDEYDQLFKELFLKDFQLNTLIYPLDSDPIKIILIRNTDFFDVLIGTFLYLKEFLSFKIYVENKTRSCSLKGNDKCDLFQVG